MQLLARDRVEAIARAIAVKLFRAYAHAVLRHVVLKLLLPTGWRRVVLECDTVIGDRRVVTSALLRVLHRPELELLQGTSILHLVPALLLTIEESIPLLIKHLLATLNDRVAHRLFLPRGVAVEAVGIIHVLDSAYRRLRHRP